MANQVDLAAYAAEHQDADELERLFDLYPELHPNSRQTRRSCGTTLLHIAVSSGAVDCVAFLMQKKYSADPYAPRVYGAPRNLEAIKAEIAAALAAPKASIQQDSCNDSDSGISESSDVSPPLADTPMQTALVRYNDAAHGDRLMILLTLMNYFPPGSRSGLLTAAIRSNYLRAVRALLEVHGASVVDRQNQAYGPLAHALECRHNRIARMLIADFGANLHYDTLLFAQAVEARFPPNPNNADFGVWLGKRVRADFDRIQLESADSLRRLLFKAKRTSWATIVFRI